LGAVSPVFSVGKSFNLNTDLFGVFTLEETDIGSELEVRGSRESKSLDHELEVFVINVVFRLHNLSFLFFITIASSNFVLVGLHVDLAINNFSTDKHVTKGHSVLGECTCLVGANARSRSEGLNRLKILDKHVLLGHTLSGEGKGDSDSTEETFRDISDNNTNGEDQVSNVTISVGDSE